MIMLSLTMQMQNGILRAPFDAAPAFKNFGDVKVPATAPEDIFPEGWKLPRVMAQSPDQGAFLVTQPVPKCGAFCYLAVVSRPPNN